MYGDTKYFHVHKVEPSCPILHCSSGDNTAARSVCFRICWTRKADNGAGLITGTLPVASGLHTGWRHRAFENCPGEGEDWVLIAPDIAYTIKAFWLAKILKCAHQI